MASEKRLNPRRSWPWYVLVLLICEKIIQHFVVTLSFYKDWGGIRSQVAIDPDILMVSGAIVLVLFVVSLWGMLSRQRWAVGLLIGLAVFDIIGEFIAQGLFMIAITVSFLVAITILILALVYRRQLRNPRPA